MNILLAGHGKSESASFSLGHRSERKRCRENGPSSAKWSGGLAKRLRPNGGAAPGSGWRRAVADDMRCPIGWARGPHIAVKCQVCWCALSIESPRRRRNGRRFELRATTGKHRLPSGWAHGDRARVRALRGSWHVLRRQAPPGVVRTIDEQDGLCRRLIPSLSQHPKLSAI
jgi:hypothetical protein